MGVAEDVAHTLSPVRALMVQGTSSSAGKSLLTTALCRHFARRGVRVAPFKAQNMSNNARVVEGGEIGVAQYLQARAARAVPDVRMNPVLVKPEAEMRSQVVVNGVVDPRVSAMAWPERAPVLWPAIAAALASLRGGVRPHRAGGRREPGGDQPGGRGPRQPRRGAGGGCGRC